MPFHVRDVLLRKSNTCLLALGRSLRFAQRQRHFALLVLLLAIATGHARGAITADAKISTDGSTASTTITSPAFATASTNELLLAFISTDYRSGTNTTVKSIAGGGLTWTLVQRANVQKGSSEIWRAFAATPLTAATVTATVSQSVVTSMTVMSFAGVNTSGTNGSGAIGAISAANASSGAPTASLVSTANNSLVIGVGNDYDNAIARTVGGGQSLAHQYLTPTGDTYWVQMLNSPVAVAGTTATINDTAPTKDRFNLALVEVLAASSSSPTYGISGTIAPSTAGADATVTLSGASNASTVADANGNYSFTGLPNGAYTVTPAATGYSFAPVNQSVTINGANQTAVNFTAQAVTSWSISGTIGGTCGGCSYIQSTHSSQAGHVDWPTLHNVKAGDALVYIGEFTNWTAGSTVNMTDSHGNTWYRCDTNTTSDFVEVQDGTSNGMSCQYTVNISAQPTITAQPVSSQCVATNCTQVGGSFLELALPKSAIADAWATPYSGISGSGANNVSCGSITLTQANDFLMCDFNNATGKPTAGTTPVSFTLRENVVTAIETGLYAGSGTITPTGTIDISGVAYTGITVAFRPSGGGGAGATVTLSGASNATTVADANGNYSFTGLGNGSYTVTPQSSGNTYNPASQFVTINGANQMGINFTAQAQTQTWSLSGTISPMAGGAGATVTLSGASNASTVADANGNYSFTGLPNGAYTVTPTNSGYAFNPGSQSVTINGASQTGINFAAQTTGTSWSISGALSPAAGGSGATVTLSGAASANTTADANGSYSFANLTTGTYAVTPAKNGYTFSPASQSVAVNAADVSNINFTAVAPSNSIAVDVKVSTDGAKASTTISSPLFSTTAYNELLLAFVTTDYLSGSNTSVKSMTGGGLTWTLVQRSNVQDGSSEIWRAFSAAPISNATVTATLSQSVVTSITVMSFTGVNTTGTNGSGAIGAAANTNADPGAPSASLVSTANNSWVLGVGNDFDNAIPRSVGSGQSLVHQYLTPTGDTYWVQMLSTPVAAAGTTVTINDTAPTKDRYNLAIVEILPETSGSASTPPTVSMTAPAAGALVANTVTVSATASDAVAVAGVQFLLDSAPLGAEVTTPPYSITWDTTTASSGPHTLTARARNTAGLYATSSPVGVTVDNSANAAVVGSWSSVFNLPAVAVNLILLQNNSVLFYQDGETPTIWDYVHNTFTTVPYSADLFCSGHALMSDGRILVVGGYGGSGTSIGIANAEIFDPIAKTWTAVPNMQYRRWYPTATTLSDGRILVTAGWQSSAHTNAGISEIYDPQTNAWTSLTNANNPFETYPFLYLLPDGRVIHIGGSEYPTDTDVLDLTTTSWSVIDSNIVDGGSATMYLPGKFMKAGSATDSQNSGPSSNTTFVLDMTQPSPVWKQTAAMANLRSFLNLTMLPDGNVLATGGETDRNGGTIANAVYAAEIWSPQTQTWSSMSSMHTPREYHGTALLLPDGRVLVSGMGADFGNVPDEKSAEFFSPPYLFKGPRPTISQAPAQIQYNSTFFLGTGDAATIASVALIRTGAVTHFFDQNERYLPLSFTQTTGGLNVTAPVDANLAPPGYYMLFIVNNAGVPSVAPFVQVP